MAARSLLAVLLSAALVPQAACAADRYSLHIERQPIARVLLDLSKQTQLQIVGMFPAGQREASRLIGPLRGEFTAEQALQLLFTDSDLTFVRVNANTITVIPKQPIPADVAGDRS